VSAARGHGVAVVCDHCNDAAVAAVAARINAEQGRLDLLVNNAWAGMTRLGPRSRVCGWLVTLTAGSRRAVSGFAH